MSARISSNDIRTSRANWVPFGVRLRVELDALAGLADELLRASTIEYHDWSGEHVVVIAPNYGWGKPTTELRRLQTAFVPRFDRWVDRCRLIFASGPAELREELESKIAKIRDWLARDGSAGGWGSGWDIPTTIKEARVEQAKRFQELRDLLEVAVPEGVTATTIGLPDTNALIDAPDLKRYALTLGVDQLDVYLTAPVVSELDNLKAQGKTGDIRAKARGAIARIKAIRDQGSLRDGVAIGSGVRIFSRPQEPKLAQLPGSLDPSVMDDRILGVAFELQRESPAAAVVLVTSDVNLQTKADLADLPFAEPPTEGEET